jgi:hypothetical protein
MAGKSKEFGVAQGLLSLAARQNCHLDFSRVI